MTAPVAGVCRFCHCTELNPCLLSTGGGETCAWLNNSRTVCSSPRCVRAFHELQKVAAIRPRKRTPADISELKRSERRDRRKRQRHAKAGAA